MKPRLFSVFFFLSNHLMELSEFYHFATIQDILLNECKSIQVINMDMRVTLILIVLVAMTMGLHLRSRFGLKQGDEVRCHDAIDK